MDDKDPYLSRSLDDQWIYLNKYKYKYKYKYIYIYIYSPIAFNTM